MIRRAPHPAALPALALAASLLVLGGAGCPGGSPASDGGVPDAGHLDAGTDGGVVDGGTDGGGVTDGGVDGGVTDGGADGGVTLRIDAVLPVRGPAAGGTRVTLRGAGFVNGFAKVGDPDIETKTALLFGSNTAIDFTVIDDDTIQVVSPPGTPGARDVTVENPNGQASCAGCFSYFTPVAATSISPAASPLTGGVTVTLTGAGLVEGTVALVGGREAASITRVDDQTLTFVAPPAAAPGPVDVVVYNGNGKATLRRAFTYYAAPRLAAVDPPVGPAAGGTQVHLTGAGLGAATAVTFGGQPATGVAADGADALYAVTPPGAAGTAVDVTVTGPRGATTLPHGFAYVDPAAVGVSLLSVTPARGPVGGGGTATLVGTGLGAAAPQVRFGSADATGVTPVDANRLTVTVPPGATPGPVTVQVRNAGGGAALTGGYVYQPVLAVASVAPAAGPAAGGTAITVHGSGFTAGPVDVRIGALPATAVTVVDDGTITCTTPAGSPGPADVVVGTGSGPDRVEASAASAFVYTAPLSLAQVTPERAAQSGGTVVTVWGTGFTDQTQVAFGGAPATGVSRLGQSRLVVTVPRGDPGLVDVTADDGGQHAVLTKAFQYYDPSSSRGGASGGPMAGTLDVTTLDAYAGAPIPGVHVLVGTDPATPLQGLTDTRGQITFSDPGLVKPVMVTADRDGYQAVSVARLDARDLTVYLTPNSGHGGTAPPSPPPAFVGGANGSAAPPLGRVCGFKLPPDVQLGKNQTAEARVAITSPSITYLPPFSSGPSYQEVTQDCGTYSLPSRPGSVSVYAVFGIKTSTTDPGTGQTSSTFKPYLMGITRGVEVPGISPPTCSANQSCPGGYTCGQKQFDPSQPNAFAYCQCNTDAACPNGQFCNAAGGCQPPLHADVILSMHMDQSIPATIIQPPTSPDGQTLHSAYSYLDLGADGAIYLGQVQGTSPTFSFTRQPELPGDGFVFLDMASDNGAYPLSIFYRRQLGDLSTGVNIGPMQPFTRIVSPAPGGALTGGRIQWSYDGGLTPDVVIMQVTEPGFLSRPLWEVILPGSETQVSVPPDALAQMKAASALQLSVTSALSPRFDFDHFSYGQLGLGAWTSFTLDNAQFVVP